jgi:hypothetical protein
MFAMSRNYQHFMKSESLLLLPQKPATGPYPGVMNAVCMIPSYVNIDFDIALASKLKQKQTETNSVV